MLSEAGARLRAPLELARLGEREELGEVKARVGSVLVTALELVVLPLGAVVLEDDVEAEVVDEAGVELLELLELLPSSEPRSKSCRTVPF